MSGNSHQGNLYRLAGDRAADDLALFDYRHKFQDDVHGRILLNSLERDVIDTPEFQRLFRVSQLGFVDLVFPTANHTRGAHSIGACHLVGILMDHLESNHRITRNESLRMLLANRFPQSERVLIRLGGLLHDITHGPFSHDIEKKKHILSREGESEHKSRSAYGAYDKHDTYPSNLTLFVLLLDPDRSTLARLLRRYSKYFWQLMSAEAAVGDEGVPHSTLNRFVTAIKDSEWAKEMSEFEDELLPTLLFHLLAHEEPGDEYPMNLSQSFREDGTPSPPSPWGIGRSSDWKKLHEAWYQPYRHDIIGNTLSADLLDYLGRDCGRLGLQRTPDRNILNYFVLAPQADNSRSPKVRTAVDVYDYKRGTLRSDVLNDIFRLLDLRHEIHERAVTHRMVHSATAMMSRALLLLGRNKPPLRDLFIPSDGRTCSLAGDDCFLQSLISATASKRPSAAAPKTDATSEGHRIESAHDLLTKIADRRLYRPLMVIPGHRVPALVHRSDTATSKDVDRMSRQIAAIIDSAYFAPFFLFTSECIEQLLLHTVTLPELLTELPLIASDSGRLGRASEVVPKRVIIWTTPYKQLYKDPALAVLVNGKRHVLDHLDEAPKSVDAIERALFERARTAIAHADDRYAGMWNIFVFLSDGLFYSGILSKLADKLVCPGNGARPGEHPHKSCLETAQSLLAIAFEVAHRDWEKNRPDLEDSMPQSVLAKLLRDVANECGQMAQMAERLRTVSAVRTDHYLHDDPHGHFGDFRKCRDIGYRCERNVDLVHKTPADLFIDREVREFGEWLLGANGPETALTESEFLDLRGRRQRHLEQDRAAATAAEFEAILVASKDPMELTKYMRSLMKSPLFRADG